MSKKLSFRISEEDLKKMDKLIKKYPDLKDRSDFLRKTVSHAIKYPVEVFMFA